MLVSSISPVQKKNYFSGNFTAFISHGEDHRKIKKAGREAGLWFKKTIADVILSMSSSFYGLVVFSVTPFKIDQNKKQNPVDKVQNLGNERR